MKQEELAPRLAAMGVVPVVTIDDASRGPDLATALARGGLPLAEITFRTDAAAGAIAAIRGSVPDVLVGAGTVLDPATVDRAIEAGAEFVVAPGFNPAVVDRCLERGIAVMPGVATPTEIEMALARGLNLLKFFPAEAMGGIAYIKAVAAPYRMVRFVPTGGVSAASLASYLAVPAVAACGGTWIATAEAIREGRWDEIVRLAAEAVAIVAQARQDSQA
jgi:2-dehydro-3-deoxyphosphogluconate aldolase / (4S)-4-hydroxy-2-oxoglutarate aldolase